MKNISHIPGCLLLLVILFADETWFILNLFVQSTGYYFQWLIQLGFHTDAFAQLDTAPDGKENPDWMHGWTIFYCKFVVLFSCPVQFLRYPSLPRIPRVKMKLLGTGQNLKDQVGTIDRGRRLHFPEKNGRKIIFEKKIKERRLF